MTQAVGKIEQLTTAATQVLNAANRRADEELSKLKEGNATPTRYAYPTREGRDIYVATNGGRIKLSFFEASQILQAWASAVGGALVSR